MTKPDGSPTESVYETVSLLLDTLIPHENVSSNTQQQIKQIYRIVPCSDIELRGAVWKSAPDKAPGADRLTARILRKAWPLVCDIMLNLVNDCLATGLFPNHWKHAEVVVIRKSPDKDPRLPKSYRPISLLPVLGKVLERIIVNRLDDETAVNLSGKQYGFTRGKSTLDAIQNIRSWHNSATGKFSLGIFLDISGAFDSLDWQMLFSDLTALWSQELYYLNY